jgi:molybdopterin-guanine dinucleotide biosynthesis protein A
LGPLGGLCGALTHASAHGFDAVLTAGCDVLPVPDSLGRWLGEGPSCVAGQRLLGLWPVRLLPLLEERLATSDDRSIRGWINLCNAKEIQIDAIFHNINTTADLDQLLHR